MKQVALFFLGIVLLSNLAACGGKPETSSTEPPQPLESATAQAAAPAPSTETVSASEAAAVVSGNGTLVVYFSRVGNTDFPEDMDAVSSATLSRVGGALKGNAQRMAEWMAEEANAELFEIQTESTYPIDYTEATDVAKQEQNSNARPALKTQIADLDSYTTVYLVFPNWWGDLPMPVYSFFDTYDFSGKTIYVSVTHEGSSFSRTVSTVQSLEPDADVIEGLSIRGSKVPDSEEQVRQFVREYS